MKEEYERISEEEGNADYGGMVQANQQHVAPCVKGVEWGLGTRGLIMVAAFWVGIPVEVTQEAGVIPRCRRAVVGTPFELPHTTRRKTMGALYSPPIRG